MKHLPAPLIAVLMLTACTERIELDLGDLADPKLVVEGWITDQPMKHRVKLTMTRSYYANEPAPVVSGAYVRISDGDQTIDLQEDPIGSGEYWTPDGTAGEVGRTYTLTIESAGETYVASDHMRPVSPIDSLAITYIEDQEEPEPGRKPRYEVRVWTQELPGVGDHYRWVQTINGVRNDSLNRAAFVDDVLYDGAYVQGVVVDVVHVVPGDTVRTEQMSITGEAYDIITAILTETDWRGGPFDPPPSNVPSNVSNGAFGFFGASSVKDRTVVVQ
ncbi:MAG: DUF4249 domain-containing protein [Flavobacteriales bacterium]|nr:DUF4249 domain-containing protein [Flavobacteriales bacterium]